MELSRDLEDFIEVKFSPIHGYGLFATSDISENELIMIIRGEVIDENECTRREEEENNVYIFWNGDYYIDTLNTNKIKYINHHCDPNCSVADNDSETLILIAAKDIKIGEELTIDYGYEEIYSECRCGLCSAA